MGALDEVRFTAGGSFFVLFFNIYTYIYIYIYFSTGLPASTNAKWISSYRNPR